MLKSPLNYAGSKHKLMPQLIKYFPNKVDVDIFYDVFAGGLSVSMNTEYQKVISNDVVKPLISFYKNLQNADNIDEEVSKIKSFAVDKTSQSDFLRVREEFNETSDDPYLFFSLVSSCTNNMMRFNRSFKFNQTFGKRTMNDNTFEKIRSYYDVIKSKKVLFTNYHYRELFEKHFPKKGDFVYLDPPYVSELTEAGYNSYWTKQDEEYLYDLLDRFDSEGIRFALSGVSVHKGVNNPYMNRLNKYNIINLDHSYEGVARIKNLGQSQEILVINY